MANPLPIWVTVCLRERLDPRAFCARASAVGVRADAVSDGRIQLPGGFLAWIEERPFSPRYADTSASEQPLSFGAAQLHISGGTNETEVMSHQSPLALRRDIRDQLDAITTPPGADRRVVSGAARKVERLTDLLRGLAPLAASVVFPHANRVAYSAAAFVADSDEYIGGGSYHFPLYVISKVRSDADGPYVSTTGFFLFGLPDMAMPLPNGLAPIDAVRAMGALQREMVAEGFWPEDGATFPTDLGPLRVERVQDGLFVVPPIPTLDPARVRVAKYRFAMERCVRAIFGPPVLHRADIPGGVVDHCFLANGMSLALSNGNGLVPQAGGTEAEGNDRVEIALFTDVLGPWATRFIAQIPGVLRAHNGARPVRPFDRIPFPAPVSGIAGVVAWPYGHFTPFGAQAEKTHLWALLPILEQELAHFRSAPGAQQAFIAERQSRRDLPEIMARWNRFGA